MASKNTTLEPVLRPFPILCIKKQKERKFSVYESNVALFCLIEIDFVSSGGFRFDSKVGSFNKFGNFQVEALFQIASHRKTKFLFFEKLISFLRCNDFPTLSIYEIESQPPASLV